MAKTAQVEEEKILISSTEHLAIANIELAGEQLPGLNALIKQYKALGFERQITSDTDFWDLHSDFEGFIQTERLKAVPETMYDLKINRVEFLNKFVVKPEGLAEFKEAFSSFPKSRMMFNLFKFDEATDEFVLCSNACEKHKEDQKQYARGNQLKVLKAADKLMEAYNELQAFGIHAMSLIEPADIFHNQGIHGFHRWRLKSKDFCFRVKAEKTE